jgi:hypothetical protein
LAAALVAGAAHAASCPAREPVETAIQFVRNGDLFQLQFWMDIERCHNLDDGCKHERFACKLRDKLAHQLSLPSVE